jgi:hypothetical protein
MTRACMIEPIPECEVRGHPIVRVQGQTKAASRGILSRESFGTLSPIERDRALPSKPL